MKKKSTYYPISSNISLRLEHEYASVQSDDDSYIPTVHIIKSSQSGLTCIQSKLL